MKHLPILWVAALLVASTGFAAEKPEPKTTIEYNKRGVEPQTYLYEFPTMCYRGQAKDVPALIDEMMSSDESPLHRDQGIQAIRFEDTMLIFTAGQFYATTQEEDIADDYRVNQEEEIKEWESYDTYRNKDVLILSDLGPQGDGTELYLTVIKPCKAKKS